MVSILSFFSGKKKPKGHTARPPSPTSPARDTPERPAARFLSLRQKATTNPHGTSSRRASSELSRKRSQLQSGGSSPPIQLPKLDLGLEVSALGSPGDTALDIGSMGRPPNLKQEERDMLRELRWDVGEVKLAWEWFGSALKATGLDTRGILLPRGIDADPTTHFYLFALFALYTKPHLIDSLPSVASHLAKPTSERPSEIWHERLVTSLRDTDKPLDISEGLKFILRRLLPSATGEDPLISRQVYTTFVQAEHASSYPLSAFGEFLGPNVPAEVASYLHEMFETWAAIATHADQNTLTGGRLAYLLGWWAYGMNAGKVASFDHFYKTWKEAGKRLEHLLYAWIRFQSTKQRLPMRMLQLVNDYPFGEASASSEHLPLPPPSSSSRKTLHVVLKSSLPVNKAGSGPEEIIHAALRATIHSEVSAPQWSALTKDKVNPADIVSEDSLSLFKTLAPSEEPLSPASVLDLPSAQEPPIYRPFQTHSRGHSVLSGHSTSSKTRVEGEGSPDPGAWDDFEKIGFSETGEGTGDLKLDFSAAASTGPSGKSVTSPTQKRKSAEKPLNKSRKTTFRDSTELVPTFTVMSEAVIKIDDIFMSFFEDAKLDDVTASWPPFSLVRLSSPIDQPKPIEWLLVSIEHIPKPPSEPSEPEIIERPTSPSARSTASGRGSNSKGLRDFATSLSRRKSSAGGGNGNSARRSFFGIPRSGSGLKEGDLPTLEELGKKKPEPVSIGEMGEIVSPSRSQSAKNLASPLTASRIPIANKEVDNVSTRALFVPTPAGTVQNSPLPSPMPTASGFEEGTSLLGAISHDGGDKGADDKALDVQTTAAPHAVKVVPSATEPTKNLAEAESSDDEELPAPRRGERSLAPSPSLPPTIREPEIEEELPAEKGADQSSVTPETQSVKDEPVDQENGEGITGLLASGTSAIAAGGAAAIAAVAAAADLVLSDPEHPASSTPDQPQEDPVTEIRSQDASSQSGTLDVDRQREPPQQVMVADEETPLSKTDLQLEEERQNEERGAGVSSLKGAKAAGIALDIQPHQSEDHPAPVALSRTSEDKEQAVEAQPHTHLEGVDAEGHPFPPRQIMVANEEAPLPKSDGQLEEERQAERRGMSLGGIEGATAAGIALDFQSENQDLHSIDDQSPPHEDKLDSEESSLTAASTSASASTIEERDTETSYTQHIQESSEERHPIEVTVETVATGTPGTEKNFHFQPVETPAQTPALRDSEDATAGTDEPAVPSTDTIDREQVTTFEPAAQIVIANDVSKATEKDDLPPTGVDDRLIEQEAMSAQLATSEVVLAEPMGIETPIDNIGSVLAAGVTGSGLPEVTKAFGNSRVRDQGDIELVQTSNIMPRSDDTQDDVQETVEDEQSSVPPVLQEDGTGPSSAAEAVSAEIDGAVPNEDAEEPRGVTDDARSFHEASAISAPQTLNLHGFELTPSSPGHPSMSIAEDNSSPRATAGESPSFSLGPVITPSAGLPAASEEISAEETTPNVEEAQRTKDEIGETSVETKAVSKEAPSLNQQQDAYDYSGDPELSPATQQAETDVAEVQEPVIGPESALAFDEPVLGEEQVDVARQDPPMAQAAEDVPQPSEQLPAAIGSLGSLPVESQHKDALNVSEPVMETDVAPEPSEPASEALVAVESSSVAPDMSRSAEVEDFPVKDRQDTLDATQFLAGAVTLPREEAGTSESTDGPDQEKGPDSGPYNHISLAPTSPTPSDHAIAIDTAQHDLPVDTSIASSGDVPSHPERTSESMENKKPFETPQDGDAINATPVPIASHLENDVRGLEESDTVASTPALIRVTESPVILHGTPPASPPPVDGQAPELIIPQPLAAGPDDDQPAVLIPIEDASPVEEPEEEKVVFFSVPETVDEEAEVEEERAEVSKHSSKEAPAVSELSDPGALNHDVEKKEEVQEESKERETPSVDPTVYDQGDTLATDDAEIPRDEEEVAVAPKLHPSQDSQEL
ncbi:hypothetical protein L198_01855 [Cryptococcus wingfieldii CBS 7118]|uniref:Meiotically up-regulated protein Msb1/Mug8 domain-containing protein n=1 Tax=Cryptococcus wingfieldii CBS 7118 TaxID=1295528 RepID=A0A1E3JY82_9TREE|nr:hypothetical protein L198_01855 [Cryptococcus wingfieldii CBS 7118]ODO05167.1 hypothetical protein L198_01855 [Cryptococcus wingfieldii CBS 7118]